MKRFDKLNKSSTAIGVGSGTEPIPFYLANKISRVYATDLYEEKSGKKYTLDFSGIPKNIPRFHTERMRNGVEDGRLKAGLS